MRLAIAILIASIGCGSGGGSTLPCSTTITAYCSQNNCVSYPPPPAFGCSHTHVDMNCGPYISVTDMGVDTGSISYYDRATGALVAVTSYSANFGGKTSCVAGPSGGFVVPQCTGPEMNLCDGGTD